MDAFEIILLILAITLAVFLILLVTAAIYAVKILRQVKRISQKAEQVADYAQAASESLASAAGPAFIAKTVIKLIKKSFKK